MELIYLVIGIALIEFWAFALLVGMQRVKHKVDAPATTGDPIYERYHRVHYNTMEQLILFVPAILMFSVYVIVPIFQSMLYSLYEWDGLSAPIWIGMANYVELLDDDQFYTSLKNNVIWLVLCGWWLVLGHIATAIAQAITIVGIPLALANLKLIPVSLLPLGKQIVQVDQTHPAPAWQQ